MKRFSWISSNPSIPVEQKMSGDGIEGEQSRNNLLLGTQPKVVVCMFVVLRGAAPMSGITLFHPSGWRQNSSPAVGL
jgi:hypothetical protein